MTPARTYIPDKPCKRGHMVPRRASNGTCPACAQIVQVLWRAANPEKKKQYYSKRKPLTEEQKEATRRRAKAWALANPERVRERSKRQYATRDVEAENARKRLVSAAWRKAHPEESRTRIKVSVLRHKARKKQATVESSSRATAEFVRRVRTAKSLPCYWCKRSTKAGERHVDHIVPLAKGGAHAAANLCVACPSCNLSKGARLPEVFSGQAELRFA